MSKYKAGNKFIIEVKDTVHTDNNDLYLIKGFNALVFNDYGLDKLELAYSIDEIVNSLERHDAKKRAKDDEINIGDEVYSKWLDLNLVITRKKSDSVYEGITTDGALYSMLDANCLSRTGRHFDQIKELLEAMNADSN